MTVGILGGGQLARMLALAGYPLGLRFAFLEPGDDPPVSGLGRVVKAAYDDAEALDRFVQGLDVVTFEFENVPPFSAEHLAARVAVFPPPVALQVARDRLAEKSTFERLGIPVAPYRPVSNRQELEVGIERLGLPAILKTTRLGYDGKGQFLLKASADVDPAWEALGRGRAAAEGDAGGEGDEGGGVVRGAGLVLEQFVDFSRELSIVAARGRDGGTRFYPLVENRHVGGILRRTLAPAPDVTAGVRERAETYAGAVLDHLEYVGVLAIELFQVGNALVANEMAPRVHNSGHWTRDGAVCDQFENHLRAICGLPLGATTARGHTAMINLIGGVPSSETILAIPGAHLHLYDKAPRPGRKLGHVNVTGDDPEELRERWERIERLSVPQGS